MGLVSFKWKKDSLDASLLRRIIPINKLLRGMSCKKDAQVCGKWTIPTLHPPTRLPHLRSTKINARHPTSALPTDYWKWERTSTLNRISHRLKSGTPPGRFAAILVTAEKNSHKMWLGGKTYKKPLYTSPDMQILGQVTHAALILPFPLWGTPLTMPIPTLTPHCPRDYLCHYFWKLWH